MASIFTKIINGEIPSHKILESDDYYSFLDINPLVMGHTLVVPKVEVDYIFDLDEKRLAGLHVFSKKVAFALKKAISCKRIGTAVIGLEVPHTHLHLIPINEMDDMNFSRQKLTPTQEELTTTADKIRSFL